MTSWSEVPLGEGSYRFQTTRWSLVAAAGAPHGGRVALEELCGQYWPPLYAFARRRGYQANDALDLTQGFFVDLLSRDTIGRADGDRGRFRSFLLTCFTHYLANQREHDGAQKRGGGVPWIPLDADVAEARVGGVVRTAESPERVFERQWALTVLERVLQRVREEYAARGRGRQFDALADYLRDPDNCPPYRAAAERLAVSEGVVKVTVHRMRQRFREILLEEVGQTLEEGADARAEIADLLSALGGA